MKFDRLKFILLILAISCPVIPATAQETAREPRISTISDNLPDTDILNKNISLDLRDMDINEALKFIATKGGINIIPTKEVSGRITLMVENVSLKDVFDITLRSNNLAYEKKGDIYNVMTEEQYRNLYGKRFSDFREVKVFHLKYAVPEQALNLLNTLKSEIGKILIDPDSGTVLIMDMPDKIKVMEEALTALEKKVVIRIFDLKYARAKDVEEQLKAQLDLKKVGSIKADERTNQVIVQTLSERMDDIDKLIQGLDKKTKQILIDAKIIQVKLKNALSSGIEWEGIFDLGRKYGTTYFGSYPFSSVQGASDPWRSRREVLQDTGYVGSYPFSGTTTDYNAGKQSISTEEMHLGVVGKNDLDLIIKYLQTLGQTRILSNPKLAVINNQEAKIHVGERQAYITTTTTQSQSTTTVAEAVTYVDVGIQLYVTPTINDEGFVTIKIKPEISSVIDYLDTSSKNKIPIIDTSTAETIVMVKDGTSILIGGLSREDKDFDSEGTPFLSKIPLIGNAFKSKSNTASRLELMILLTPHIISGDELITGYDRDFGHRLDKEYQNYSPISEEKPILELKTYQSYPALGEPEKIPGFKPAKEF